MSTRYIMGRNVYTIMLIRLWRTYNLFHTNSTLRIVVFVFFCTLIVLIGHVLSYYKSKKKNVSSVPYAFRVSFEIMNRIPNLCFRHLYWVQCEKIISKMCRFYKYYQFSTKYNDVFEDVPFSFHFGVEINFMNK